MRVRSLKSVRLAITASIVALVAGQGGTPAHAQSQSPDQWSFVISTAPGLPQDIWLSALGSNAAGWHGGGVLCLGPLAQGLDTGQHATLQTTVLQAGILGVDGQPVPDGDYTAPGEDLPARSFTLVIGQSFFVIFDAFVAESNIDLFPAGAHVPAMFTFDFVEGRTNQELVTWLQDPAGQWHPFLNEGLMLTNIRRVS